MNSRKNLQYNFPKMRGGGGVKAFDSKAVWNFSENSSVLEMWGIPYTHRSVPSSLDQYLFQKWFQIIQMASSQDSVIFVIQLLKSLARNHHSLCPPRRGWSRTRGVQTRKKKMTKSMQEEMKRAKGCTNICSSLLGINHIVRSHAKQMKLKTWSMGLTVVSEEEAACNFHHVHRECQLPHLPIQWWSCPNCEVKRE